MNLFAPTRHVRPGASGVRVTRIAVPCGQVLPPAPKRKLTSSARVLTLLPRGASWWPLRETP